MSTVIALVGLKGSGKSTSAGIVSELLSPRYRVGRDAFARAVRELASIVFDVPLGTFYDDSTKETSLGILGGRTPREVMRNVGEGVRKFDPDFWINTLMHKLEAEEITDYVLVDDCRFRNELDAIHAAGGVSIYVERGLFSDGHASEQAHLLKDECDYVVDNVGSIEELKTSLASILSEAFG